MSWLTLSGIPLDVVKGRTTTWMRRFPDLPTREAVTPAILQDVPTFGVFDDAQRADYIAARLAAESHRPVAYSEEHRKAFHDLLFTRGLILGAEQAFSNLHEQVLPVLEDGIARIRTLAFADGNGAVYVMMLDLVPVRWPLGATLVRRNFIERVRTKIQSVQERSSDPVVGAIILGFFFEDGVPGAELGFDVKLVVSSLPGPVPPGVEPLPLMLHSELVGYRDRMNLAELMRPKGG
jgi:hypothetical protein